MVWADMTDAKITENTDVSLQSLTEERDSDCRYSDVSWHLLLFTSNDIPHVTSCYKTMLHQSAYLGGKNMFWIVTFHKDNKIYFLIKYKSETEFLVFVQMY